MKPSAGSDLSIGPAGALYEMMREHGRAFVLVDRFSHNPLHNEIAALPSAERPQWFPLSDPIFGDAPERSPALLELRRSCASHVQLLDKSLELSLQELSHPGQARAVCAWIFAVAEAAELARGMTRGLDAWADGKRIYLRYFDPRVMPRLVQLLDGTAANLIAPAIAWCQLGRRGEWMRFDVRPSPGIERISRMDRLQNEAIERIEAINKIAARLALEGIHLGHERDEEVDGALRAARKTGLTESDDQETYALHCMRHGDSFSRHPGLGEWVLNCQRTGLPLAAVLAAGEPRLATD